MTGLAVASSRKATEAFEVSTTSGENGLSSFILRSKRPVARATTSVSLLGVRSRAESLMSSTTAVNSIGEIE